MADRSNQPPPSEAAIGPMANRPDVPVLTRDQKVRVFISSTLGELAEERQVAANAVCSLDQTPVRFEDGASPHGPIELYREYLRQSQIFVGIYWNRYGKPLPGEEISGIEDEWLRATGKDRLIYIKEPADEIDPRLDELLKRIKATPKVTYKRFKTPEELYSLVRQDVRQIPTEHYLADTRAVPVPRLPADRSPFIGREDLVRQVVGLLAADGVRLVTLTGTGGVGKTRVALEAGRRVIDQFPDGEEFVDLAGLADAKLVSTTILTGLGEPVLDETQVLSQLRTSLGNRRLLLLLDNFEHLLDAAPDISEVLAACPNVKVVVTSRSSLAIGGEREIFVEPMDLPDLSALPASNALAEVESIALFVERAQGIRPSFRIDDANARAVAEICVRVDGIPLGIELAAAATRIFPDPSDLLNRLKPVLPVLEGGRRDAPERQRTMRNAIQWSFDLLSPEDQQLLRRLSVFVSGFTLAAAETITLAPPPLAVPTVQGLDRLLAASLVRVQVGMAGGTRYSMLETIREFASGNLDDSGERDNIERAFVQYYVDRLLALAERYSPNPHPDWMNEIDAERDNLQLALVLAERFEDPEPFVRLVWNNWRYWNVRGSLSEGRRWLDQAIARDGSMPEFIQQDLRMAAAIMARRQRDYPVAEEHLQEVLAYHVAENDAVMQVSTLHELSSLASDQAALERAKEIQEGAESIARDAGYVCGIWTSRAGRGGIEVDQQHFANARPILEEAIRELRALGDGGDAAALGSALANLGRAEQALGELDRAIALTQEAIDLFDKFGDSRGGVVRRVSLARMLTTKGEHSQAARLREEAVQLALRIEDPLDLASARLEQGRFEVERSESERRELLTKSLLAFRSLQDPRGVVESLEGLAALSSVTAPAIAASILGSAQELRRQIGFRQSIGESQLLVTQLTDIQQRIDSDEFNRSWDIGRTQSIDATIQLAVSLVS